MSWMSRRKGKTKLYYVSCAQICARSFYWGWSGSGYKIIFATRIQNGAGFMNILERKRNFDYQVSVNSAKQVEFLPRLGRNEHSKI